MEESSLSRARSRAVVSFLNVARTYIPNTKVECHYTLPPGTIPSASDWIGIFKVSWDPFWLVFMGNGFVGIRRVTRFLDSQTKSIKKRETNPEATCTNKTHLPILALSFPDRLAFAPAFLVSHHLCHYNTILHPPSVFQPPPPSIDGRCHNSHRSLAFHRWRLPVFGITIHLCGPLCLKVQLMVPLSTPVSSSKVRMKMENREESRV